MKSFCPALFALSLLVSSAALALPDASPASPPHLVGSWSWSDPRQCSETYEYADDGSGRVASGEERAEMAYIFDPAPLVNGFHRLDATITRDNGMTDCAGAANDDTRARYTVFIKFSQDGEQHIVCMEPDLEHCFGPLQRQRAGRGI
ncbi:hypothetical protein [Methyloversatilis thermotolerans]|uniref:hypothetical protein n=1 Tax=Methyloversatilis thermotolerans TaxID=1346290 RepID=UPI0003778CDF|nr:hypothetical protein [Methyloversatilis thermotolerans]